MKRYMSRLSAKQEKILKGTAAIISIFFLVVFSNLFLQWCQNDLSADLALKFAFSWHTEKFFLACLVLLIILILLIALVGSVPLGSLTYVVAIGVLGFTNYMKMSYRQGPIYPDDLKVITEIGLLKDMTGTMLFTVILATVGTVIGLFCWCMLRSLKKGRRFQLIRLMTLLVAIELPGYISNFSNPDNLLRKVYNKTALWIPYSQEMNYYNTGFIGGFLYNLKVKPMDELEGYSEEKIKGITEKYQKLTDEKNKTVKEESPSIVSVMSESFSDPGRLDGVGVSGEPLADYYEAVDQTYSGNMLSQNYGGGTANIEFEALTGFSMALFNAQLTAPYTMLVPKMDQLPSIASALNAQSYQTTAIHPYSTSMYKREDIYQTLGFDQLISECMMTYTDTIESNPYISDKSTHKEVMTLLKEEKTPQFIHLVTIQTHMLYDGKHDSLDYPAKTSDGSGTPDLENYLQDISYSSTTLKQFTKELKNLPRRILVVFWGDHLPGIYSDTIQTKSGKQTLHETQLLMPDSKGELEKQTTHDATTGPFYFAANLMEQTNQTTNGFYQLLLSLEQELPVFERELYYQNGQWYREAQFNRSQQEIYNEYQLIQYDIVVGKQYSLADGLFEHE